MKHYVFYMLTLGLLSHAMLYGQDRITGKNFATRSEVIAKDGIAATSHPLATQVALDILKKGGNAMDAAIAANALLGLVEPTGCGIGGDLFAIIWDAETQQLYGLNASGRSPGSLPYSYFKKHKLKKIPSYGPLPVTVPGAVDGWNEIHQKFGKLSVDQLLEPVIKYAEEGFPLSEVIAYYWKANSERLKEFPGFTETFMPDGRIPEKGELFKNPRLANTYRLLAENGFRYFYEGRIAYLIEQYMAANGGFLTATDLAAHHSEWVEPVSTNYRGYDVWQLPPNGQGLAVLQMLNMLELYDVKAMGFGSKEYIHLFTEVKKLAFEDRALYYADPDFYAIPVDKLISKAYASERMKLFNPDQAGRSYPSGILETDNTIYLTIADGEGNMVSLIQSNYRGMGSGMTPDSLGFILQDRGESFSLEEGHPNIYAPNKRPFHTIIPGFVTKDGQPWLSFGLMGGSMQPQGHVQVLVNLIDFGMNLQEAGDAMRISHEGSTEPTGNPMSDGGWLNLESGFNYETIRELMKLGHRVKFDMGGYGGYQAIMKKPESGVYYGASESRKDGQAAGF
ncbi:MAG: gamma-glutamyltransferase [Bacteroidales bacterium]|jgi:gamma-glutamyltranspeptidase/glutathione hydrolase|nr:gamma-glutamyltransferase [Bacteroidales bacterium]MDY0369864.1 gamma-glutamyltransferase [Bacteroidales bacterium]